MKVISVPEIKNWVKKATCLTCETIVELEISDFYGYHSEQRDGESCKWNCPTCKKVNFVAIDNYPRYVKHLICQHQK